MMTNRKPVERARRRQITPKAVELFRRALALQAIPHATERWEPEGRRREYLDISGELHAELGLGLGEEEVLWVADEGVPEWMRGNERRIASELRAQRLRRALKAALADAHSP
jgi:hypothetical protein